MDLTNHVNHLRYEVEVLKSMVREYDTGHIITAIQVLDQRIKQLEASKSEVLDSSYPDGYDYWKI